MTTTTLQPITERAVLADMNVNKVLNLTEASTLESLRTQQHKDVNGNIIGMSIRKTWTTLISR